MQDLFCLSFDFKMFFFSMYFWGVVLYVFSIGMRMCVTVDWRDQPSLGHSPSFLCLLLGESH